MLAMLFLIGTEGVVALLHLYCRGLCPPIVEENTCVEGHYPVWHER